MSRCFSENKREEWREDLQKLGAHVIHKGGDQLREALDAKLILETVKVFGTIPSRQRVGYAV